MFDWQQEQRGYLNKLLNADKFPHAILMTGPDGTGKSIFAQQYAKKILCDVASQKKLETACGQCHSCQLFAAATHPDYIYTAPEEAGKIIKIDVIRDLIVKLSTTSNISQRTVAIIDNAEQLNKSAANALLKTLEEPTPNTIVILVCSYPHRLLPTIRSRCLQLSFPTPDKNLAIKYLTENKVEEAALYLQLAHGSPLQALEVAQTELADQRKVVIKNLIKTARGQSLSIALKEIDKIPLRALIDWSVDFCDDLIKVKLLPSSTALTHIDVHQALQNMASHCRLEKLYAFRDVLIERKKQSNIALNPQLLLEDLLLLWKQSFQ